MDTTEINQLKTDLCTPNKYKYKMWTILLSWALIYLIIHIGFQELGQANDEVERAKVVVLNWH